MKQYTVTIPDNKVNMFIEMMKNTSYVKQVEDCTTMDIPEEHKKIVRERIKASKAENMIPWREARKQLTFKEK